MKLTLKPPPLPLETNEHGVVLVKGTRVPLDFIVYEYRQGAAPEEILQNYPSRSLEDLYAVIHYYLRHRAEVDQYILEQEELSESKRREIEALYPQKGLREKLLERLKR